MKNNFGVSRRKFIRQTSLGLGAGLAGVSFSSCDKNPQAEAGKMARRVRVAGVDLRGLHPEKTREKRVKRILSRMEDVAGLQPDFICLTELFDTIWVDEKINLQDVAEDEKVPGPVTGLIAEYAAKHKCYVVCPIYTKKDGKYHNSSLLIDRKGNIAGAYNKIHPVVSEILTEGDKPGENSVYSGSIDQPVIETDLGKVGMQICYDANWADGWANLKNKGAEIIFFSSAYPGGRILNYYAWRNNCYIVSSSGMDARVVDMSGNILDASSTFVRYAWADINLEKVNTDTWPTNERLPDIFNKYGNRVGVKVWENTQVITLESLDPTLKIRDVLKEFDLLTIDEVINASEAVQDQYRIQG